MAYFTDPMGDEFKKAMEEAMKELEKEEKVAKKKSRAISTPGKTRMKSFAKETKRELK